MASPPPPPPRQPPPQPPPAVVVSAEPEQGLPLPPAPAGAHRLQRASRPGRRRTTAGSGTGTQTTTKPGRRRRGRGRGRASPGSRRRQGAGASGAQGRTRSGGRRARSESRKRRSKPAAAAQRRGSSSSEVGQWAPRRSAEVRFKTAFGNTILDVLRAQGWTRVRGEPDTVNWDFIWADVAWVREHVKVLTLPDHVRINHFPNHYELTRKDLLVKNLKRRAARVERDKGKAEAEACLSFCPTTYKLPQEYRMFVEDFKRDPSSAWISKPVGSAQGKGIFMLTKLSQLAGLRTDRRFAGSPREGPDPDGKGGKKDKEERGKGKGSASSGGGGKKGREKEEGKTAEYIVQRYVASPYLIGGKKFDIRIYVLVTSFAPLRVWLYREGFARFSGSVFSMSRSSLSDQYIHLTNVAIQKTKAGYDKAKGCKWLCSQIHRFLVGKHGQDAVDRMNDSIDNVILQSLQAVAPVMIQEKHCFEVYGYDILLDTDLNAWLIEVNASPSLTADTPVDYELKTGMLEDLVNIVNLEGHLLGSELRVGGFDRIWDDGPVYRAGAPGLAPSRRLNSFLGFDCEHRKEHLRQAKLAAAQAREDALPDSSLDD